MTANRKLVIGLALVLALVVGGCGDDDDSASPTAPPVDTSETGSDGGIADDEFEADGGGGTTGTCSGTSATGSTPENGAVTLTSAAAASILDGVAYTVYLADFELDTDSFSAFSNPTVPEGSTMFTVAATIFNAPDDEELSPIAVGDVIPYTPDFGVLTIRVTVNEGEEFFGTNTDAVGTLTVTAVGDTFCGEIDYSDGEKSLTGTFEAPTRPV